MKAEDKANRTRNILLKFTDKEMKNQREFFPIKEKPSQIEGFKIQFEEVYTSSSGKQIEKAEKPKQNEPTNSGAATKPSSSDMKSLLKDYKEIKTKELSGSIFLLSLADLFKKKKVYKNRKIITYTCDRLNSIIHDIRKTIQRKKTIN